MREYLAGAEPFLFDGGQTGCLLIHGFTGTPYEMRGLGTFLSQEFGYTVSGPALAGHATRVEDCASTTWHDWYASVETAYHELQDHCTRIFAIGLSLGGALVLHLAEHQALAGVVAVSAPIYIKPPYEFWFRTFPFLFRVFPYIDKINSEDDTQDPAVRAKHPGYARTPTRAARSLILDLLPHVRADLVTIQTPTLLLQSCGDHTIPPDSMPIIYEALGTADKRQVWLDRGGHLVLEDYDHDRAFQLIGDFITRQLTPVESLAERAAQ